MADCGAGNPLLHVVISGPRAQRVQFYISLFRAGVVFSRVQLEKTIAVGERAECTLLEKN